MFSFGGSKSKSSSEASASGSSFSDAAFNENVFQPQVPYLEQMWGAGTNLFNMGVPYFNPMMAGGVGLMDRSIQEVWDPWRTSMSGGVYGAMDTPGMYQEAFNQLGAPPSYQRDLYTSIMGGEGNDYVDALSESMRLESDKTLGRNLAMLDQRAGLMSGSSPHNLAMAKTASESADDLNTRIAQLGFDTFDKDLALKLDIAGLADQNWLTASMGRMDAARDAMAAQQATMFGGMDYGGNIYGAGMNQFMMPMQYSMYYPQFMGQPIVLGSGTSGSGSEMESSSTSSSKSGSLSFGIG